MTSQTIIKQVVKWRDGGATRPACIKKLIDEIPDMTYREAKQLTDTAWFYEKGR